MLLLKLFIALCFIGFSLDYLYRVKLLVLAKNRNIQDTYNYSSVYGDGGVCSPPLAMMQTKRNTHELEQKRWSININEWFRYGGIEDAKMKKHYIDNHVREAFISVLDSIELDQAYSVKFNSPVLVDKTNGDRNIYPFSFPINTNFNNTNFDFDVSEFMSRQIFCDYGLYVQVDIQKQNTTDCYAPNYIEPVLTITRYRNIENSKIEMFALAILGK